MSDQLPVASQVEYSVGLRVYHMDVLAQVARAMQALCTARQHSVTTEAQHNQLIERLRPSEDVLMAYMEQRSGRMVQMGAGVMGGGVPLYQFTTPAEDPYMTLVLCLKQAAADGLITVAQWELLVARLRHAERTARAGVRPVVSSIYWLLWVDGASFDYIRTVQGWADTYSDLCLAFLDAVCPQRRPAS